MPLSMFFTFSLAQPLGVAARGFQTRDFGIRSPGTRCASPVQRPQSHSDAQEPHCCRLRGIQCNSPTETKSPKKATRDLTGPIRGEILLQEFVWNLLITPSISNRRALPDVWFRELAWHWRGRGRGQRRLGVPHPGPGRENNAEGSSSFLK